MSFNYRKLKGRIVEICGNQTAFAKEMRLSERTISLKMQGKIQWRQNEIMEALRILRLSPDDVQEYFFDIEVQ